MQGGVLTAIGVGQLGWALPAVAGTAATAPASASILDLGTTQTLEAWADTIVPGEKRSASDVAIAGAAPGPSAVVAGALDVLTMPEVGLATLLPGLATLLNVQATTYALSAGLLLNPTLPAFVALPFAHRTSLAATLLTPGRADHSYWVLLATLSSWAFDIGGAQSTVTALKSGHPGLAWIGFPAPNADGVWRFPNFSYRRQLAVPSPRTTTSGSPA
jgi:hypothetical protein